jgi:hypothetical protein
VPYPGLASFPAFKVHNDWCGTCVGHGRRVMPRNMMQLYKFESRAKRSYCLRREARTRRKWNQKREVRTDNCNMTCKMKYR